MSHFSFLFYYLFTKRKGEKGMVSSIISFSPMGCWRKRRGIFHLLRVRSSREGEEGRGRGEGGKGKRVPPFTPPFFLLPRKERKEGGRGEEGTLFLTFLPADLRGSGKQQGGGEKEKSLSSSFLLVLHLGGRSER